MAAVVLKHVPPVLLAPKPPAADEEGQVWQEELPPAAQQSPRLYAAALPRFASSMLSSARSVVPARVGGAWIADQNDRLATGWRRAQKFVSRDWRAEALSQSARLFRSAVTGAANARHGGGGSGFGRSGPLRQPFVPRL